MIPHSHSRALDTNTVRTTRKLSTWNSTRNKGRVGLHQASVRADVRAKQTAVERPPFELLATGETLLMRIYTCPPCPFEGFDSIAGLILQGGELKTSGRATFQRAACHRATKEAKTGRHAQIKGRKIWQSIYYTSIYQKIPKKYCKHR